VTRFARDCAYIGLALLATLPFLDKAFHIDDVLYLTVAHQIIENPWLPYGDKETDVVLWDADNGKPASLFHIDFNPPLWKYFLAGVIHFAGDEEWKLHLLSALFVALAAIAWGRVAEKWTSRPIWVVAMILISPFFLPGQNIMLEVPVLCFVGWGVFFLERTWRADSIAHSFLAGLFFGLALLTKYSAAILLPVVLISALLFGRPRVLLALLPAGLLLGLWCLHNHFVYGEFHLTSHGNLFEPSQWGPRSLNVIRTLGGVSILWPILFAKQLSTINGSLKAIGIMVLASLIAWLDWNMINRLYAQEGLVPLTLQSIHAGAMTFFGSATLLLIFPSSLLTAIRQPRVWLSQPLDRILEIWIAGALVFNVACTPFNAVRHLLLALVPLTLWTARQASPGSSLPRFSLIASMLLAFTLAAADYEMAGIYRTIAQTRLRDDRAQGDRVWFTGNWGFTYYARKQGALPLFDGTEQYGLGQPTVGDRIYNPVTITWSALNPAGLEWIDHLQPTGLIPLRTIAPGSLYYGMKPKDLPWSFQLLPPDPSTGRHGYQFPPLDHVRIWQVKQPGVRPISGPSPPAGDRPHERP
jgi:hypothetical protein